MSPRWAEVSGYGLYFYAQELHRRPHVAVRGGEHRATLDVLTGEVLAGSLPPNVLRRVRNLLSEHREEALEAFADAIEHRIPRRLGEREDER